MAGRHVITRIALALGLGSLTLVGAQLQADFTVSASQGTGSLRVQCIDQSSGAHITQRLWLFGDGCTSDEPNPWHTYVATGPASYDVLLKVWSGTETDVIAKQDVVRLTPSRFTEAWPVVSTLATPLALCVADLDLDGDQDVACAGADGLAWSANLDSAGSFGAPQFVEPDVFVQQSVSVQAADLDSDGDPELIQTQGLGGASVLEWFDNTDGLGGFGPAQQVAAFDGPVWFHDVRAADVDADGDLDLLVTAAQGDVRVSWWLNDGRGGFPAEVGLAQASVAQADAYLSGPSAADLDDDGDLDLAATRSGPGGAIWYAQESDGSWTFHQLGFAGISGRATELIDLDHDGDDDLVFASTAGLHAYRRLSPGVFGPLEMLDWINCRALDGGDLDGDGDPDLATAGKPVLNAPFALAWHEVLADGQLAEPQVLPHPDCLGTYPHGTAFNDLHDIELADLDGDGDLDLVTLDEHNERIDWHENRSVPEAWSGHGEPLAGTHGPPGLVGWGALSGGATVSLGYARGLPGASATLVLGLSQLDQPFKGGVLVPNPDVLIPAVPLDAGGRFALNAPWPSGVPAGLQLFAQVWALDGTAPAGLSASGGVGAVTVGM